MSIFDDVNNKEHEEAPASTLADESTESQIDNQEIYDPREAFCRSAWFLQISVAISYAIPFATSSLPFLLVTFPAVQVHLL